MKKGFIYIMTNVKNNVFYIGVTRNLRSRVYQHKEKLVEGFSKKYNCTKLIYFEESVSIDAALNREKKLKNWHRQWKVDLINSVNPEWCDLAQELI